MAGTKKMVEAVEDHWQAGSVIDHRFLLRSFLGSGGIAEVWSASPVQQPDRTVAIKRLIWATRCEEARRRFQREIQILKQLSNNANIVAVYDSGEHLGQEYLVLEYMVGSTLRTWLGCHREQQRQKQPL